MAMSRGKLFLVATLTIFASSKAFADDIPYKGNFSLTYTFTTSTPARPIDVGGDRDLTVNTYLATTINDAGSGLLHNVAGHCTSIRFTNRKNDTIDSHGYCNFKDQSGDMIYVEYTTGAPQPSKNYTSKGTFVSGTGRYEGISGSFDGTNTNNLDTEGTYQAAGKMVGSYKIIGAGVGSVYGQHD
jgi:hypothetical protein